MFTLTYVSFQSCNHEKSCTCSVRVDGKPGTPMEGVSFVADGTQEEKCKRIAAELSSRFSLVEGQLVDNVGQMWKYNLINRLHHSPNMEVVPPPIAAKSEFMETPAYGLPPQIIEAYKYADRVVLPKYYDSINFDILHSKDEEVDDFHKEVRRRSAYWSTFGTKKGRPFRVPALQNAAGQKTIDAVMGYSRKTKDPSPQAKEMEKHMDEAVKRLYNAMGYTQDQLGKERSVLDFSAVSSAYMGSSAGLRPTLPRFTEAPSGERVVITATGKKIDVIVDDFEKIMAYLTTGQEFETYWTFVAKVENYFSWEKQDNDETWAALLAKMRLFNIPTSTFVRMEDLVSKVRMKKERGKVIMIGHKWAHGGADKLAENLGINDLNHWKKILAEGDLKNMDQTVLNFFIKLYMETMLIHEDPASADYSAKVKILEYIVPRILRRLTRLYSDVWVHHHGTVPSGCFNTSHMDSWIMGLYFFLFCVAQLINAPEEDKVGLEELIENVCIVVYGDDHLYNKGETRFSHYLSAYNFQAFFEVGLRCRFERYL